MNNYSLIAKEAFNLIKENSLYSSLTIIVSFIITNKIIIPLFSSRKKYRYKGFSALKIEKLIDFLTEKKSKNYIFSYLNFLGNNRNKENEDNNNNPSDKIQKTKKIIKKLTEEYITNDKKTRDDKYDSRKDQIFYLLLNNMHVIKENNNITNNNFSN